MKAIILARVSTEEQMCEGQSIPAQLAKAREYAKRKEVNVYKEFSFDESSIKDRRKKFEIVIEEIKKSKEKKGIRFENRGKTIAQEWSLSYFEQSILLWNDEV
ncbi:MAG: recombinase family protein [Candidatus Omnitrophica bacterium]|nr:recombinase family protein [Candidatus Omnitrophota bacterium]MCM8804393.1 recombinase family protein [Candidatus Omnitrophota bacterium]